MMSAMTTRLTHDLTYDAPLADVVAMLGDQAFREEVCRAEGVLRHEVRIEGAGAGMHVVLDRVQGAGGIPSFASRFIGDEINIVQEESWRTAEHFDVTVTIPGKPGEMSGAATLSEAGGVTTESVAMDIRVRIPLVGGKIEKLLADMLRAALVSENRVGRAHLSR